MAKLNRSLLRAAGKLTKPIKNLGTLSIDTIRSNHRKVGQYTVPEIDKDAPDGTTLNPFGKLALLPLAIGARATAATLTPALVYSAKAAVKTTRNIGNIALADCEDDEKFPFGKEALTAWQHAYGIPGHLLGLGLGASLATVTTAARSIKHTAITSAETYEVLIEDFDKNSNGPPDKSRGRYAKFLGAGGIPLGVLGAFFYFNLETTVKTTENLGNLAYFDCPEDKKFSFSDEQLKRWQHVVGLPGHLLGFGLGASLAAGATGVRVAENTSITTVNTYHYLMSKASPEKKEPNPSTKEPVGDSRSLYAKGLGAGGLFFGAGLAATNLTIKSIKPMIHHSKLTFIGYQAAASNLVLTHSDATIANDTRDFILIYGLGGPGAVAGLFCFPFTLTASTLVRAGKENFYSLVTAYESKVKHTDQEEQNAGLSYPDRPAVLQYGVGLLGHLAGTAAGEARNARVAENSYENFLYINGLCINPLLTEPLEIEEFKNRSRKDILLAGLPGTMACLVSVPTFYAAWTVGNSIKSSIKMTGSMLNGATGRRAFTGLGSDHRKAINKVLGSPGSAVALLTLLPLTSTVFVGRKLAEGAVVITALGLAPAVAVYKHGHDKPRFEDKEDHIEFQNIYALLTAAGNLPEGKEIKTHPYTSEGRLAYLRHVISLNEDSLTEEVLNYILAAHKEFDGDYASFFRSHQYRETIRKLKHSHRFEPYDQTIEDISTFLKEYLLGNVHSIPTNLYANEPGWYEIFMGKNGKNPEPLTYPTDTPTTAPQP